MTEENSLEKNIEKRDPLQIFAGALASLFGTNPYRITFEDEESERKAYRILLNSKQSIDWYKDGCGVTKKQLELLQKETEIKYKMIE